MEKKGLGLYEAKEMKWNNGMRHGKGRRSHEMLWGIIYNKTRIYSIPWNITDLHLVFKCVS